MNPETAKKYRSLGFFDYLAGIRASIRHWERRACYQSGQDLAAKKVALWKVTAYADGRSYLDALRDARLLECDIEAIMAANAVDGYRPSPCVNCSALALCAANKTACNVFNKYCMGVGGRPNADCTKSVPTRDAFEALSLQSGMLRAYNLRKAKAA